MATDHALHLGRLVGNLHSLEAMLRFYLVKIDAKQKSRPFVPPDKPFVVGAEVPKDAFTNYDTLGTLIKKFNAEAAPTDPSLSVDPAVIDVRDLLAHGRVSAATADEAQLEIVKFDEPMGGQVRVVAVALMDEHWFDEKIRLVRDQIDRVAAAMGRRQ
jgi:hypothetical protein